MSNSFTEETLKLKQIQVDARLKYSDTVENSRMALAISNKYGLLAVITRQGFVVKTISSLHSILKDAKNKTTQLTNLTEHHLKSITCICFANNDSLFLAANSTSISIYKTNDLLSTNSIKPITIQTTCLVSSIAPNPQDSPNTIAILFHNGNLHFLENQQLGTVILKDVTAISWSTLGKQISCATKDGKILQLTLQGVTKNIIEPAPDFCNEYGIPHIKQLAWIENKTFIAMYSQTTSDESIPYTSLYVIQPQGKNEPSVYIKIDDPCFNIQFPHDYYFQIVRSYGSFVKFFLFIASSGSTDVGAIGFTKTGQEFEWGLLQFPEGFNAILPLNASEEDTFPAGIAVDFTSTESLVGPSDTTMIHPCPRLWIYTNEAELLGYYFINSLSISKSEACEMVQVTTLEPTNSQNTLNQNTLINSSLQNPFSIKQTNIPSVKPPSPVQPNFPLSQPLATPVPVLKTTPNSASSAKKESNTVKDFKNMSDVQVYVQKFDEIYLSFEQDLENVKKSIQDMNLLFTKSTESFNLQKNAQRIGAIQSHMNSISLEDITPQINIFINSLIHIQPKIDEISNQIECIGKENQDSDTLPPVAQEQKDSILKKRKNIYKTIQSLSNYLQTIKSHGFQLDDSDTLEEIRLMNSQLSIGNIKLNEKLDRISKVLINLSLKSKNDSTLSKRTSKFGLRDEDVFVDIQEEETTKQSQGFWKKFVDRKFKSYKASDFIKIDSSHYDSISKRNQESVQAKDKIGEDRENIESLECGEEFVLVSPPNESELTSAEYHGKDKNSSTLETIKPSVSQSSPISILSKIIEPIQSHPIKDEVKIIEPPTLSTKLVVKETILTTEKPISFLPSSPDKIPIKQVTETIQIKSNIFRPASPIKESELEKSKITNNKQELELKTISSPVPKSPASPVSSNKTAPVSENKYFVHDIIKKDEIIEHKEQVEVGKETFEEEKQESVDKEEESFQTAQETSIQEEYFTLEMLNHEFIGKESIKSEPLNEESLQVDSLKGVSVEESLIEESLIEDSMAMENDSEMLSSMITTNDAFAGFGTKQSTPGTNPMFGTVQPLTDKPSRFGSLSSNNQSFQVLQPSFTSSFSTPVSQPKTTQIATGFGASGFSGTSTGFATPSFGNSGFASSTQSTPMEFGSGFGTSLKTGFGSSASPASGFAAIASTAKQQSVFSTPSNQPTSTFGSTPVHSTPTGFNTQQTTHSGFGAFAAPSALQSGFGQSSGFGTSAPVQSLGFGTFGSSQPQPSLSGFGTQPTPSSFNTNSSGFGLTGFTTPSNTTPPAKPSFTQYRG